ncbi:CaMKII [Symbiodinium natans]|uniref:CaMKII protein n=1 Tax=Symbiodinium natans TaxID=878477 RepID=A0A812KE89_9DINO|nr:CaMKII [Symbiodinium natans]
MAPALARPESDDCLTSFDEASYEFFGGGADEFHAAYEELEQLGQGEFGVVRRAYHRKTGVQAAVKHLPKSPKSRAELAALSQMRHENIARLYAYFEADQELLLVIELCDVGLLSELLVKRQQGRALGSSDDCVLLMQQLLAALSHCHDSGRIHNDLKFDNIMLASGAKQPKLKLIDFGNSLSLHEAGKTPSDDMWFAGLTFFQLVTGLPFFLMDSDELESLDEQGVYVDPQKMQCDSMYLQLRLSIAKRFASSIALDLLAKMLQLDRTARIAAAEALDHPFFLTVRRAEADPEEVKADKEGRKGSLQSVASTAATVTM